MTSKKPNPFPGGLLVLSPKGSIIEAPQFFMEALRLEDQDPTSIYHLFDDQRVPFLMFDRVLRRNNGIFEFYVSVVDESDRPRGFRYWSVSPNQSNKRHTPITFYIVDESSLLQSQEWKRRRLRRDILNHVRMSLSQYIRTRLTSIQALTEVVRDNPTKAQEGSERLLDNIDELLDALDDMIAHQGIDQSEEAPRVRLRDASELIASWGDAVKQVHARAHDVPDAPMLPTDMLEMIILPLVQNAMDASYPDEPVEVNIWDLANGFARVDIQDRGDGMSQYVREHAEDPFFSTKPGHLGLGLSQAYEALQSVGGHWRFESEPKRGTRVTVLLPLDD